MTAAFATVNYFSFAETDPHSPDDHASTSDSTLHVNISADMTSASSSLSPTQATRPMALNPPIIAEMDTYFRECSHPLRHGGRKIGGVFCCSVDWLAGFLQRCVAASLVNDYSVRQETF